LKMDESGNANPKAEISNWTERIVQLKISAFGLKMQDLSIFKIPLSCAVIYGVSTKSARRFF
jgi:hypothetical protein